ncbi:MAG: radical SAM protein [Candidatus Omnitrophica bacterium]|nr:radical SAM protein [Candidatus Omnitrophota bacterium]
MKIKRVLLINPPASYFKTLNKREKMFRSCSPPLGLCYLATFIADKYDVKVLDALVEGFTHEEKDIEGMVRVGLSAERIKDEIEKYGPDIVGVAGMFTDQYRNSNLVCRWVKEVNQEIYTVVGGTHPSCNPEMSLKEEFIDFVILGEGEVSFSNLLECLNGKGEIGAIDGIGYKTNNQIFINEKKSFIQNLDSIPIPNRDYLPMEKYFNLKRAHGFSRYREHTNLITSRGCPANCVFCAIHSIWGKRYRFRSAENVIAEIEYLVKKYGIKEIQFEDDNLTVNRERAVKLFQGMIERNLGVCWSTPNGVAVWALDEELLELMRQSGCWYVCLAIESGSQRVLNEVIRKPLKLEKVRPIVNKCKDLGFKVDGMFIIGGPGETKEEMQQTLDFAISLKLDNVQFSIMTPFPGTPLWDICLKKGYFKQDMKLEELFIFNRANISTEDFTTEEIVKFQKYAYRKYYSSKYSFMQLLWLRAKKMLINLIYNLFS